MTGAERGRWYKSSRREQRCALNSTLGLLLEVHMASAVIQMIAWQSQVSLYVPLFEHLITATLPFEGFMAALTLLPYQVLNFL